MIDQPQYALVGLSVSVGVFAAILSALLIAYRQERKRARYDEDLMRAQLEGLRRSLERDIYELTDRMVASERRWRDINHLLVSSQESASALVSRQPQVGLTEFLSRAGVTEETLTIDRDLVFVLTPFHEDYWATFDAIASLCREVGLKCLRGDEERVDNILHHILRLLVQARVVVANVDGRNPNVYYELGIAHAMDKGTILISKSLERLPADLQGKYFIVYRDLGDLQVQLRRELLKALVRT